MNGSIHIGNLFGIPVRIHLTFLLLVYVLALFAENALTTLGLIGVSFGCVLLHELGHSLVARAYGLRVADITLWPLGGIARMSAIPESPRIEARIAIAGPAVNFALAGLALLALAVSQALGLAEQSLGAKLLWFFLVVNLLQGGFNLLPAFPMDGGRLLRAFLARRRDWLSATELAARVGRWLALTIFLGSLVVLALWPRSFCLLPLVALFLWYEGMRELLAVRLRHGGSPFGGAIRFGFGGAPARAETPPPVPPSEPVERGTAHRPRTWLQRLSRRGGFTDEDVRRLESYRAPLKRPPEEP